MYLLETKKAAKETGFLPKKFFEKWSTYHFGTKMELVQAVLKKERIK